MIVLLSTSDTDLLSARQRRRLPARQPVARPPQAYLATEGDLEDR